MSLCSHNLVRDKRTHLEESRVYRIYLCGRTWPDLLRWRLPRGSGNTCLLSVRGSTRSIWRQGCQTPTSHVPPWTEVITETAVYHIIRYNVVTVVLSQPYGIDLTNVLILQLVKYYCHLHLIAVIVYSSQMQKQKMRNENDRQVNRQTHHK